MHGLFTGGRVKNAPMADLPDLPDFLRGFTLPSMPEAVLALVRTFDTGNLPVSRIRELISRDPALAVNVVRLANSALFGLRRHVTSLDDAILLVGLAQVRALALTASLQNTFPIHPSLDRHAFWRHSLACGGYAQWLARATGADAQEAWLAGVMLRMGELVIAQVAPSCLEDIEAPPLAPGERWERELTLLGFAEGVIAAEMARAWNFPDSMIMGLTHAAQPALARPYSRLAAMLHLAGLLADMPEPRQESLHLLPPTVLAGLGLVPEWIALQLPQGPAPMETVLF